MNDRSIENEARKLRELFRGRFDQDTALRLIDNLGGLCEAIDFVMTEDPGQVSAFLKKDPDYLQKIREDSAKLATILDNKIEDSVRQFICGDCKRSWWKRVPLRKEVSKCRRCHIAYDPIPRENESGTGKFICPCGNEFTGFATMGETKSECYECGEEVLVDHMIPPRRDRNRKTTAPHSCNGVNCYNPSHGHIITSGLPNNVDVGRYLPSGPIRTAFGQGRFGQDQPNFRNQSPHARSRQAAAEPPMCVHPKSQKMVMRVTSKRHISTGSTVSTFLSQGSVDTQSVSVTSDLYSIRE